MSYSGVPIHGSLTEVEGSVQLISWSNWFESVHFSIKNINYFFIKQVTLMRRSIVLSN